MDVRLAIAWLRWMEITKHVGDEAALSWLTYSFLYCFGHAVPLTCFVAVCLRSGSPRLPSTARILVSRLFRDGGSSGNRRPACLPC